MLESGLSKRYKCGDRSAGPTTAFGRCCCTVSVFLPHTVRPSQNMSLKAKTVCGAENTRRRSTSRIAPIGAFHGSPIRGTIPDCASSTLLFLNLIVLVYIHRFETFSRGIVVAMIAETAGMTVSRIGQPPNNASAQGHIREVKYVTMGFQLLSTGHSRFQLET